MLPSRQRVFDAVLNGPDLAHELVSPWGMGKTWLMRRLMESLLHDGYQVLHLAIGPEPSPVQGSAHPLACFRWALNLAGAVAGQLPGREGRRLRRSIDMAARKASFLPIKIDQSIHAGDHAVVRAEHAQSVHIDVAWSAHVGRLMDVLEQDVAGAVLKNRHGRPGALFIDDFHHLGYPEVRHWLLNAARRLPATLLVVARHRDQGEQNTGFRRYPLRAFAGEEIAGYLSARLGRPVSGRLVELVGNVTGRMPWAVTLAAEAIAREPEDAENDLRRLLRTDGIDQRFSELLDLFFADHPQQSLRTALERLSIPRRFDRNLAALLLEGRLPAETAVKDVLTELRGALLLDSAKDQEEPPARGASPGGVPEQLSVPDAVRAIVLTEMREQDPHTWTDLHVTVADHYWTKICARSAEDGGALFSYWSRFENRSWPRLLTEWIHHVALIPGRDPSEVRTLVTRSYLEGFFWYDWYVPHWFCERLLDACGQLRADGANTSWLDSLEQLHSAFPRGWRHDASPEQWRRCTDALLKLRDDAAPPDAVPPASPTDRSQILALVNHLLGDVTRCQNGDPVRGAKFLETARTWYVGDDVSWSHAYLDLHEADLWMRAGDPRPAGDRLRRLERTAREMNDNEMLTLVMQMAADRLWHFGRREEAMNCHLGAVAHALRYQIRQLELTNMSHFPDAYTRELYVEMTSRARERLTTLRAEGGPPAARFEDAARHTFASFWRDGDAPPDALFPPPPDDRDLGVEDSDYARRVRWWTEDSEELLARAADDSL
jgi:hypothetical protein